MAREYARIKVSIWSDPDFRALTAAAQQFYFLMLTSPDLDLAGVVDWRPARIAKRTAGATAASVRAAAAELVTARFLIIDEDTEEALVRSFVRHDGILKSPNMTRASIIAWMAVGSESIRRAYAVEVQRAAREEPGLPGLPRAEEALHFPTEPDGNPSGSVPEPFENGSETVSEDHTRTPSGSGPEPFDPRSPLQQPATSNQQPTTGGPANAATPAPRGARIPEDFPTPDLIAWARTERPDLDADAVATDFRDYWVAQPGAKARKTDWAATWRRWVRNQNPRGHSQSDHRSPSQRHRDRQAALWRARSEAEQQAGAAHLPQIGA